MSGLRATVIVLVLLAGGAVVSVAVAWGCAIWSQPVPATTRRDVPDWPIPVGDLWGEAQHYWESAGTGVRIEQWSNTSLLVSPAAWPPATTGNVVVHSFGWPALGMHRIEVAAASDQELARPGVVLPWLSGLGRTWQPVEFPLHVAPVAFAANTAVYAAVLTGLLALWGIVRRKRQRRRGLCVPCGYDVHGLAVCPECGLAVGRGANAEVEA